MRPLKEVFRLKVSALLPAHNASPASDNPRVDIFCVALEHRARGELPKNAKPLLPHSHLAARRRVVFHLFAEEHAGSDQRVRGERRRIALPHRRREAGLKINKSTKVSRRGGPEHGNGCAANSSRFTLQWTVFVCVYTKVVIPQLTFDLT
jgi:hypothetical protein